MLAGGARFNAREACRISYVWFPDWEGQDPQDLYEQSMVLGHYGTVLTLLWLADAVEDED